MNIKNPCGCGKNHESATKTMLIQKNVTPALAEFIKGNFGNNVSGGVICDRNTYAAAAESLIKNLDGAKGVILDIKSHHADEFMVEDSDRVLDGMGGNFDYYIAAGAGTIHDITRLAAHKRNAPFISYPTAPSVDGFVSDISPITTKNGMKITVPAIAPAALFADAGVLAAAPKRLAASGVGDMLGKYIALADWRIADLLTGEYICEAILGYVYSAADKVRDSLAALRRGELPYEDFCEGLLESLAVSGLCMQYAGNSRPASGAEHHVAHFLEMGIILSTDGLHGENVGFGSVMCAGPYHSFAQSDDIRFIGDDGADAVLVKKYYADIYDEIVKENAPDSVGKVAPEVFYGNLAKIKEIIADIPAKEEIAELLNILGGVTDLEGVKAYGLKCGADEIIDLCLKLAPYVRDRLTLLKLMKRLEFSPRQ